jgi:hypothetical protein
MLHIIPYNNISVASSDGSFSIDTTSRYSKVACRVVMVITFLHTPLAQNSIGEGESHVVYSLRDECDKFTHVPSSYFGYRTVRMR